MRHLYRYLQLLSDPGAAALAQAAALVRSDLDFLPVLQKLEREYPHEIAREAVSQALFRVKAARKFSQADRMFFTKDGLEQASGELVSNYRADRLGRFQLLFDLTAGIGGDAISFARKGPVVAVERDERTVDVLQANSIALGLTGTLFAIQADSTIPAWRFPRDAVIFLDPARRTSRGRVYSIHHYEPDFLPFTKLTEHVHSVVVKVSPAVRWQEISGLSCEINFISAFGELKEAALWFGESASTARRATILPQGWTLTEKALQEEAVTDPGEFLYEPDPAVLRAGLVQQLAYQLGCTRIEPSLGLLTSNELRPSAAARCYRILDVLPFGLKRLRKTLRDRGIGSITLKKRGSAVDTEVFEKQLHLSGENHCVVLLTRTRGGKVSMLLEEIRNSVD
ncbi:MAG: hypothetical protein JXA25_20150 [Anaerolineales bacterium]|nr:hypothetical protein [Anaerolineales bacterium]